MSQPKVTIKIPKPLYEHIKGLIADSGFNSVTDFVVYVLRDIVYEGQKMSQGSTEGESSRQFTPQELEQIKIKLKSLGYL